MKGALMQLERRRPSSSGLPLAPSAVSFLAIFSVGMMAKTKRVNEEPVARLTIVFRAGR